MSAIQEFAEMCGNEADGGNFLGDAYRKVARTAKTLGKSALDTKDAVIKPIKKTAQKAVRKVSGVIIGTDRAKRIERYGDAVLFNTAGLPPSVKEALRNVGDEFISKIVISRNPVQKLLTGAMNVVSLGSFNKKFGRLPYDDLFHLALLITIPSGTWAVEKNEVITFTKSPVNKQNAEFEEVTVKQGVTLNSMMAGSEKILGDKFTKYDAYNNNCQDFVLSLLQGSGMGSPQDIAFIKQNTDTLFKNDSFLRRFSRNLTNVGASVATAISGVDDTPIESNPQGQTFSIPTAIDTDVQDAVGGVKPNRKPKKKAVKSERVRGTGSIETALRIQALDHARQMAQNPTMMRAVMDLIQQRDRGLLDANFNRLPDPPPPDSDEDTIIEDEGEGGSYDDYTPMTQEDSEVASFLDPPAIIRAWNTMSTAEKKAWYARTTVEAQELAESFKQTAKKRKRASTPEMFNKIRASIADRIGKGGRLIKMSKNRRKEVVDEALNFLDGDLYQGIHHDVNHYLRRALAVR